MELNQEMNDQDRTFAQGARQALRQSERALDADTAARLGAARAQAVAAAGKPRWVLNWLMPMGAVAAALMVFALLPIQPTLTDTRPHGEAMEVMLDEVEPDLVQDLDLYVWLEFDGEPT